MGNKQLKLFNEKVQLKVFGGSKLINKRKSRRPLSTRRPIHLILRSEHAHAYKAFSYKQKLNRQILYSTAKKYQIRIYESVFNHNHVHMIIRIPNRSQYIAFIRVFTAGLSRLVKLKSGKLFSLRPFTRVLSWGRDYQGVMSYLGKNWAEAVGSIDISHYEIMDSG